MKCGMIVSVPHPDDPNGREIECTKTATAVTEDDVPVCDTCGESMRQEGFEVHPFDVPSEHYSKARS